MCRNRKLIKSLKIKSRQIERKLSKVVIICDGKCGIVGVILEFAYNLFLELFITRYTVKRF